MLKGSKIFYIDDDADDLFVFGESISKLFPELELLTAQSSEEGLSLLRQLEDEGKSLPILIILDMNMPKMDGKQTLAYIKSQKRWLHIPIVIFTTSYSPIDIEFCQNHGAHCIVKPINFKSLNQTMGEIVAHSKNYIKANHN